MSHIAFHHDYRVARNIKHFETWAIYQSCEQAAFSDLPEQLAADADHVFNVSARLPKSWIEEVQHTRAKSLYPHLIAGISLFTKDQGGVSATLGISRGCMYF